MKLFRKQYDVSTAESSLPAAQVELIEEVIGPIEDTYCGKGKWARRLRPFATPMVYLLTSSVISLIQGTFFTYSNATLSTVEKRFGLTSKLSGFTTAGNDVTQLVLSIPFAFIAGGGHRPRWLAFGMVLAALSCFLAVSPHFLVEPSTQAGPRKNTDYLCTSSNSTHFSTQCTKESTKSYSYIVVVGIFLFAQMLAGVASLLYYTIGYSYLDDSVSKSKSPLYLSIAGGVRLLGPVCGYSLASWALNLWIHPGETSQVSISPAHPRWVGAWWVGYTVIGTILFVISWVLLILPKRLPATRRRKQRELIKIAENGMESLKEHVKTLQSVKPLQWKELFPSLKRLMTNKVYRIILLNQVLFWFGFFGYITFKSKFLEHQFRLSAAQANKYIAGVSLGSALLGFLGTGATLSYFKPKPKTVIYYMAFLSMVSCLCHFTQMTLSCNHGPIVGLESVLHNNSTHGHTTCSSDCHCDGSFSPVCHVDKSTVYFSPCEAGCQSAANNSTKMYSKCSCLANSTSAPEVVDGFCAPNCPSFTTYIIVSIIAKTAQAASRVPLNILLFRCVNERDKDLGLGVFNAVIAFGASIPAPAIFGWIIDSTCILWGFSCSEKGHCWLNDIDLFRKYIHGLPAAILVLCVLTDLALLRHHKSIRLFSECDKKPQPDPDTGIQKRMDRITI